MKIRKYLKNERILSRLIVSVLISLLGCFLPLYFLSSYLFMPNLVIVGLIQAIIFFIFSIIHFYIPSRYVKVSNIVFVIICVIILLNLLRYSLTALIIFISQNMNWVWG